VCEFVKEVATPFLRARTIDKDEFKEIARKATDKIVEGQLASDQKCHAIKDKDKFMSDARTKKMKGVVEKYVHLLSKKDGKGRKREREEGDIEEL